MSDPITAMAVGAAIGGGTSLARGKGFGSALQSAALGGALGGGGSALGGLMGGAGAAAGGASTGSGLLSGLQGVATTPVSFGTGGFASGIGGQVIPNVAANVAPAIGTAAQTATQNFIPQHLVGNSTGMANYVPGGPFNPGDVSNFVENTPFMPGANLANTIKSAPNFTPVLGRSAGYTGGGAGSGGFFGGIQDMFGGLSTSDKLGIGLKGVDLLNQPQQQMPPPQVMPIRPGNPEMVSTPLYNVAPNVGMQEGNDMGLPNLLSRMPLSEEELLRLQQQLQTTGYRGR